MDVVVIARPGAEGILDEYKRYNKAKKKARENWPTHNKPEEKAFGVSAIVVFIVSVVASIVTGSALPLIGIALAVALLAGSFVCMLVGIPLPKYHYDQAVRQGDIISVPGVVIRHWDRYAKQHRGLAGWDEYPERRFEALALLVVEVSHTLQLLAAECKCGKPQRCVSTTHLSKRARHALRAQAASTIRAAVDQIGEEFLAQVAGSRELRRAYEQTLPGVAGTTLPPGGATVVSHLLAALARSIR